MSGHDEDKSYTKAEILEARLINLSERAKDISGEMKLIVEDMRSVVMSASAMAARPPSTSEGASCVCYQVVPGSGRVTQVSECPVHGAAQAGEGAGESYPGQAYFHEHNANIRRAELASELPAGAGPRPYAIVWIVEQNGRVHSCHATREHAEKEKGTNLVMPIAPWAILGSETARATQVSTEGEPCAIAPSVTNSAVAPVTGNTADTITSPARIWRRGPRPGETNTPLFEAIWRVVKDWEIQTPNGSWYSCTGDDVRGIIDSIAPVSTEEGRVKDALRWMKQESVRTDIGPSRREAFELSWRKLEAALAPAVAETQETE